MRSSCCDRRGWRRAVAVAALASVASFAPLGCGAACDTSDDGNPPERYAAGHASGGTYESSPWGGPLLPFPGGKQYELEHHLGFAPAGVHIYFGFGSAEAALSPCAGNSCVIRHVDDQLIWIQNDTCAEFSVRVVAWGNVTTDAAATLDAGNEAGSSLDAPLAEGASAAGDASTPD